MKNKAKKIGIRIFLFMIIYFPLAAIPYDYANLKFKVMAIIAFLISRPVTNFVWNKYFSQNKIQN
jgi:hypothetical protein